MRLDNIQIRGLRVYAFHGVNPEEKEKGQPFVLDITCFLDLSEPCRTDKLEGTVSYAQIVKLVKAEMGKEKYDLLEHTAQKMADAILDKFPTIQQVDILLKKPRAPILADFDYVAVEISRGRENK